MPFGGGGGDDIQSKWAGKLQEVAVDWQSEDKSGKSKESRGKWLKRAVKLAEEFTDDFEGDEDKKQQRKALLMQAEAVATQIYGEDSDEDESPGPSKFASSTASSSGKKRPPAGKPSYLVAKPKPEGEEEDEPEEKEEEAPSKGRLRESRRT